ncbi:hypothetical protein Misp01_19740 [Microtetraspora sp. NBRC 13810]|uniref:MFS transporter n=1 Tax=Microtetraspora sp. NBRC 13810 TaxID=3030990 RepID=UPI0024A1B676|nr:MFS transporter [Microtetraspora sp. NBRC 13810]GLW06844.1 hypothetical protein Misp01_19740 [Microtetraspora sp. NBRC 13810]
MNRVPVVLSVLALGTLVLGTSELGVVGLLPAISGDLGLSPGATGSLVTVYAVAVALAGPPLAAVLGRLPRRTGLTAALAALAVGNAVTAAAPRLPELLAARALTGAAAAAYAAIAVTTAVALTGPARYGLPFAVNALVTAGHYTAFTYLVVSLTGRTGLSTAEVGALLLCGGVAGTIGNAAGGVAADRAPRRALAAAAAIVACCLCAVPAVSRVAVLTWPVVLVWAAAFAAFSTVAQSEVAVRAGEDGGVAAASNISVFNIGIAVGSAAGGLILQRSGLAAVHLAAAGLVLAGLAVARLAGPRRSR